MQRLSNIELLRIISIIFVLIVHADYGALQMPLLQDLQKDGFVSVFLRILFEASSIICVNIFVLISGYFGIKPKLSSIVNLIFQCFFFVIIVFIVYSIFDYFISGSFPSMAVIHRVSFFISKYNWFIPSYLCLMLFSPILNSFVETASSKKLLVYIIILYILSYYWGTLVPIGLGFGGYGFLFFIILYLIGRYIKFYGFKKIEWICKKYWVYGYLLSTFTIVILSFIQLYIPIGRDLLYVYDCPLVLISSIFFFLYFASLKIQATFINRIASSVFAVLLLHVHPCFQYIALHKFLFSHFSGVIYLSLAFIAVNIYFWSAILLDQLRIFLYKKYIINLESRLSVDLNKYYN